MLIKIDNRCFITIAGNDRKSFLQGITTINIDNITNTNGGWGAVLSERGKFLYGFFVFEHNDTFYMETNNDNLMEFGKYLSKFALNNEIQFGIEQGMSVYADTDNINNADIKIKDPRSDIMGARLYSFNDNLVATETSQDYETLRIKNTIIDLEQDGEFDNSFPMELNMDKLNGIDFDKGCFIGQEPTARMHYKDSVKKNMYTIICDDELQVGTEITNKDNRPVGKITSWVGNMGIAILRNQYINDELFTTDNQKVQIKKG